MNARVYIAFDLSMATLGIECYHVATTMGVCNNGLFISKSRNQLE